MITKKKLVVNKKMIQQLTDEELSAVVGARFDGHVQPDSAGVPGGPPPEPLPGGTKRMM